MDTFRDFGLSNPLLKALDDLGFEKPTPVQREAYKVILSGKNVVATAQTGTGKTLAYILPLLHQLKFSQEIHPRVLILVPTRELVLQVVEQIESAAKYKTVRVVAVYGGTNIKTQILTVSQGSDILVATPGRLYDLVVRGVVKLKKVKKLVIDEVDVMLDLGFRFQLNNILDLLPERRQNIMLSATMTDEIDDLIIDYFISPAKISIAVSGTPLDNIDQKCIPVPNFFTKVNLLAHLLNDREEYRKVLVFAKSKKNVDRIFDSLTEQLGSELGIIHSNKSQNFRLNSIEHFEEGSHRILISTDVIARGLDLQMISHVINFDTPIYPENYMHRIGRTGRAKEEGKAILFYTEDEIAAKKAIETLMDYTIPILDFPQEVEISAQLIPDERPNLDDIQNLHRSPRKEGSGSAFHEKSVKNQKVNEGGSYKKNKGLKYKKPKTRGDKRQNNKKKR